MANNKRVKGGSFCAPFPSSPSTTPPLVPATHGGREGEAYDARGLRYTTFRIKGETALNIVETREVSYR